MAQDLRTKDLFDVLMFKYEKKIKIYYFDMF